MQAYLKTKLRLTQSIFIHIKKISDTSESKKRQFLRILKPLYGTCDVGDYRGSTVKGHLSNDLKLVLSFEDCSLCIEEKKPKIIDGYCVQVYNYLSLQNVEFQKLVKPTRNQFWCYTKRLWPVKLLCTGNQTISRKVILQCRNNTTPRFWILCYGAQALKSLEDVASNSYELGTDD